MNLKSLWYGVWYGAQYGAQLIEKFGQCANFFCGAYMHRKSTQVTQNIVLQNFKFFESC